MAWVSAGASGRNKAAHLVEQFLTLKQLGSLGFQFDGENLSDLEAQAFLTIEAEIKRIELNKTKRAARGRR